MLLELAEEKQQQGGDESLDGERGGRGLETRADVGELAEEKAIAGGGKGDACAGHDGSVERDEDGESHGCGDESRPGGAGDDGECRDGGPFAGGDADGGQDVLDSGIGGHEEYADDEQAADEGDGQAAFRALHLAGNHGEVVPAVVSPEGGDQRGHESAQAAHGMGHAGGEVGPGAAERGETQSCDDEDQNPLEHREDKLKVSGFLYPKTVQPGHEPGDEDGEDLRPEQRQRSADGQVTEAMECGKELEGAGQADGDGGDRGRLGHGEPGPHIKESGSVAVRAAQVDIFAAGIGQHGAQFCIGHGAEQREQAADNPGQVDKRRRTDVLHHLPGNQEDAAADDGADDDSRSLAGAQNARQVGQCRLCFGGGWLAHAVM